MSWLVLGQPQWNGFFPHQSANPVWINLMHHASCLIWEQNGCEELAVRLHRSPFSDISEFSTAVLSVSFKPPTRKFHNLSFCCIFHFYFHAAFPAIHSPWNAPLPSCATFQHNPSSANHTLSELISDSYKTTSHTDSETSSISAPSCFFHLTQTFLFFNEGMQVIN